METDTSPSVAEAGRVFVDPSAYADESRLHAALALLRRESPVHRVDEPGFDPFWAVTRHADVMHVESHADVFLNGPRPVLVDAESDRRRREQGQDLLRTLIHMDDPDHRSYRAVTADWFLPKSLKRLDGRMAELATRYVDRMGELGGECDFAQDVAVHYPLHVILSLLGLPESDYPMMLKLTQELFGAADPELQRGTSLEDLAAVVMEFFQYFGALTASRREQPTDDLASVIANATIDGEPLGPAETLSYYVIIATAGHDTTSSAIAGGLLALLEHPDQLERLRADRSLLPSAIDEMIRWVTPVKHFMRTATEDREVGGVEVAAGDSLLLSYPSANRDDTMFDAPGRFDVARHPNRHLAFGFGAHYCLGAQLAKMEMRAMFAELLDRVGNIELAGEPQLTHTVFVGGPKHVRVRYSLRA